MQQLDLIDARADDPSASQLRSGCEHGPGRRHRRHRQGGRSFGTLLKAAAAAGLVETLQGPGPFTVFAPTDAAFAALPAGTLDKLLADPPR